jgi:hypothetical protein
MESGGFSGLLETYGFWKPVGFGKVGVLETYGFWKGRGFGKSGFFRTLKIIRSSINQIIFCVSDEEECYAVADRSCFFQQLWAERQRALYRSARTPLKKINTFKA